MEDDAAEVLSEGEQSESSSEFGFGGSKKNQTSAPKPKQKAKDAEKNDKLISKGKAALTSLEQISSCAIWQGTIKEKDIENRIHKAMEASSKLDQVGPHSAGDLSKQLSALAEKVENSRQLFSHIQMDKLPSTLPLIDQRSIEDIAKLPADCLNAMLSDIARKLLEDWPLKKRNSLFQLQRLQCL